VQKIASSIRKITGFNRETIYFILPNKMTTKQLANLWFALKIQYSAIAQQLFLNKC